MSTVSPYVVAVSFAYAVATFAVVPIPPCGGENAPAWFPWLPAFALYAFQPVAWIAALAAPGATGGPSANAPAWTAFAALTVCVFANGALLVLRARAYSAAFGVAATYETRPTRKRAVVPLLPQQRAREKERAYDPVALMRGGDVGNDNEIPIEASGDLLTRTPQVSSSSALVEVRRAVSGCFGLVYPITAIEVAAPTADTALERLGPRLVPTTITYVSLFAWIVVVLFGSANAAPTTSPGRAAADVVAAALVLAGMTLTTDAALNFDASTHLVTRVATWSVGAGVGPNAGAQDAFAQGSAVMFLFSTGVLVSVVLANIAFAFTLYEPGLAAVYVGEAVVLPFVACARTVSADRVRPLTSWTSRAMYVTRFWWDAKLTCEAAWWSVAVAMQTWSGPQFAFPPSSVGPNGPSSSAFAAVIVFDALALVVAFVSLADAALRLGPRAFRISNGVEPSIVQS